MITRISPIRSVTLVDILLIGPAKMVINDKVNGSYDILSEFKQIPAKIIIDNIMLDGNIIAEQFSLNKNHWQISIARPSHTIIESSMNRSEFAIMKDGDEHRIIKAYS